MKYHFEKPTITPHTLAEQLKAMMEMLDKRDKAWQEQWIDTVPSDDEATAFSELQKLKGGE